MDQDYRGKVSQRIGECKKVLKGIKESDWWNVIEKDLNRYKDQIDKSWHLIDDEDKLRDLKFNKFAVEHILNLESNYQNDLDDAKDEMEKLNNPDKKVHKDYDNETQIE